MRRIKLTVQYDGTYYKGWQRQNDCDTVQGRIESALHNLCKEGIEIHASGRTDVGVHALGQVFHFDTSTTYDRCRYVEGCNHFLPLSIRIVEAEAVSDDFHARLCVKSKTYVYKIVEGQCALLRNRAWGVSFDLDFDSMQRACGRLLGLHDFGSFVGAGSSVHTTVRHVYQCSMDSSVCAITGKRIVTITVRAKGFLYNMVRIMVGLLVDVGRKLYDVSIIDKVLDKISRAYTKTVAPSYGLYLHSVEY